MSGYITAAEECGALVDAGLMGRDEAVLRVFEAASGGLTVLGAENALDEWQTLRGRFADLRMNVELGLAAVQAAIRAEEAR